MVLAHPFRGLRPTDVWDDVDHLQPRSSGFDKALDGAQQDLRARQGDGRLRLDHAPTATAMWIDQPDVADHSRVHRTAGVVLVSEIRSHGPDAVLAHEHTFPEPVARRVRTRNTLAVETVPTLVLLREPVRELSDLLSTLKTGTLQRQDAEADHHAVVLDPEQSRDVAEACKGTAALIADGHHRIAAATSPDAMASGTGLTWLVAADHPAQLSPVHRMLHGLPTDSVRRLRSHGLECIPADARPSSDALVLVLPEGAFQLEVRPGSDAAHAVTALPTPLRRLPVALGHHILHRVLELGTRRDRVRTTTSSEEAVASVVDVTTGNGALLACGPTLEQVWAAAEQGIRMPPKATWFTPKPISGAVLRPLDQESRDG